MSGRLQAENQLTRRRMAYKPLVAAAMISAYLVRLDGAGATDFQWTGPPGTRIATGEWFDPANWSPLRGGVPNSFADTATIGLDATVAYDVRVDRDLQLRGLKLDSPSATLLPTGVTTGGNVRTIEFEPGGSLTLSRGSLAGALRFLLRSANVDIGPGLSVERGGREGQSPVVVARGPANSLTAGAAELDSDSPEIAVLADSEDSHLALGGPLSQRQFSLLEGATVMLDAAPGNTATLVADDRAGRIHVVNAGDLIVGSTLPHAGQAVLAFELQQMPGGVLEVSSPTTLGSAGPGPLLVHRNSGNVVLRNETLTIAPVNFFINSEGGLIGGTGLFAATSPIANFGSWDPSVAVQGDLVNEATALLSFDLRERIPGVDVDELVVSGTVTLGGTLQVTFADGFSPQKDDVFDLISAGSVVGQFERILPPALPDDMAILLVSSDTGLSLQVAPPVPVGFNSTMPTAIFSQAFGGMTPQANWAIELANVSGAPQQVVVTDSETNLVQSVHIAGGASPEATMTLVVEENALLAASGPITVGTNGQLVLASGGEAFAPSFAVAGGSLEGGGKLVGTVHNQGHVSPGFGGGEQSVGVLTIEGDYVQNANGVLEIDVLGLAPGQHDVLVVTGEFSLAGNVLLDLSEFKPSSSFSIEIVDGEGVPVTQEPMCNVIGDGKCAVMAQSAIGPNPSVFFYLPGDFDLDGDIDRDDLVVWQMNAGFMGPTPPPSNAADADNDGDVDGDDLLAVLINFGKGTLPQGAAAIPEPGCISLASLSIGLVAICAWRRRRMTNRSV